MKKLIHRTFKSREKGAVLIVAMLVSLVMVIMVTPFMIRFTSQFGSTERSYKALSALNLAEAGVERAIYEMNNWYILPWQVYTLESGTLRTATLQDFSAGDSTVIGDIDIKIFPEVSERRMVEATGNISHLDGQNPVNRTVRVMMIKGEKSLFDFGIFADDFIDIKTNVTFDSYDSGKGDYGEIVDGEENITNLGNVGTNGYSDGSIDTDGDGIPDPVAIIIEQGASSDILGSLAAGPDTNPDDLYNVISLPEDDPEWLDGERHILPDYFEMPSINLYDLPPKPREIFDPDYDFQEWFTQDPGPFNLVGNTIVEAINEGIVNSEFLKGPYSSGGAHETVYLTSADSGIYSSFVIEKGDNVVIPAGEDVALYVTAYDVLDPAIFKLGDATDFSSENNTSVTIEDGASLTLILGNTTFEAANNSWQTVSSTPSDLMILGTDEFIGDFYWNNNTETYAAIYVPRANVILENNYDMFGAIIGDSITIKNNVGIHYDTALGMIDWITGGLPYWTIGTWVEAHSPTQLVVQEN